MSSAPRDSATTTAGRRHRSGDLGDYEQGFFLHIPKTAGRSFGRLLRRETAIGDVLRIAGDDIFPALSSADRYQLVQGHVPYPVAGILKQPLFVMTFLRRPVDRALSLLEYGLRRREKPLYGRFRDKGVETAEQLVERGIAVNRQTKLIGTEFELADLLERFERGEISASKARAVLQLRSGKADREMLERAKVRLERMQFVGLTEAFDASVRLFAELIGMTSPPTAYKINTAPATDQAARKLRYDDAALGAVASANRLDQELYEFGVELFRKRYEDTFGEPPDVAGVT